MTPGRWKWNNPAIIHHDNNNVDIFIHRARSKFFLLNADRTKAGFCTPQDGKTVNFQLPHEDECQRLVLDLTRVYQQFLMEKEKV
jgi:cold shock CspA family protein